MVSAISGELTSGLTTHHFLKTTKKISGKDINSFATQWIFSPGSPKLDCEFTFNRKKNIIELRAKQDPDRPRYMGNLTIRIHEPDGTFDHVILLEEYSHRFDLLYHTKYKRLRNNKKAQALAAKLEKEKVEMEKAEGLRPPPGTESDEELTNKDPEIFYEIRKSDWDKNSDGEEVVMNAPIAWIRLDPELELLCDITFRQSDFMWSQQLAKDKDVVAQYEAIRAMEKSESIKNCCCLFRVLMDVRSNYLVRMEAAFAMARGYSSARLEHIGIRHLLLAYRKKFAQSREPTQFVFDLLPRRNDFRALTEYFVHKAIVSAMAMVRNDSGDCPREIRKFLLTQLQLNDNIRNEYSDNYYVAALIEAIGGSFLPTSFAGTPSNPALADDNAPQPKTISLQERRNDPLFQEALSEMQRHLFLETQIPSYHNTIAQACLGTLLKWMLCGLIPLSLKPFLLFSRSCNFPTVRQVCLDALILLGWTDQDISKYLVSLVLYDMDMRIRLLIANRLTMAAKLLMSIQAKTKQEGDPNAVTLKRAEGELRVEVEDLTVGIAQQANELKKNVEQIMVSYKEAIVEQEDFGNQVWSLVT
jgi:transcription initiation factor TFIID subunit 2